MWGTHLDLIQNPQIRAKHGGKEHINVSPGLAGVMGAAYSACCFPKGVGLLKYSGRLTPDTDDPPHVTPQGAGPVGWTSSPEGILHLGYRRGGAVTSEVSGV